eukprot:2166971-Rhodomonas_salina.5
MSGTTWIGASTGQADLNRREHMLFLGAAADELDSRQRADRHPRGHPVAVIDVGAQEARPRGVERESAIKRAERAARGAPRGVDEEDEEPVGRSCDELIQMDLVVELQRRLARDLAREELVLDGGGQRQHVLRRHRGQRSLGAPE